MKGAEFYAFAKKYYLKPEETLTDIDAYISDHLYELLEKIESSLYDKVNDDLYFSDFNKSQIYDPWDTLSNFDGEFYEYEDIDIFELESVAFEREENTVYITAKYKIQFSVQTAGYEGKDEDTKQVFLSPYRKHKMAGCVEFILQKSAMEFLFDLTNYEFLDIVGKVEEIEYDDGYIDDYYD